MEIFYSPLTILCAPITRLRVDLFIEQIASAYSLDVYGLV